MKDNRISGNQDLIPIQLNKCAFRVISSAAKRSREICFFIRFLHFRPLCGLPVEMTKSHILIIIGIIQRCLLVFISGFLVYTLVEKTKPISQPSAGNPKH
jgi:hypothetical protein